MTGKTFDYCRFCRNNGEKEEVYLSHKTKEQDGLVNQLKERVSAGFILEETVVSLKLQISQLEENLAREKERADAAREVS